MRLKAIFREVKQDVLTGNARLVGYSLLIAAVITGFGLADMVQINALVKSAEEYQKAGASVSVLSAVGQISGPACDALSSLPGINASGAVREETEKLTFTVLKASPVPISTVTPGFADLLGVETSTSGLGVYLSDQVTEPLQVVAGDTALTDQGWVEVGGTYTYPSDGRVPGYGYAALVPSNDDEPYDECWANIWPQSDETKQLLYTAVYAGKSDSETKVVMGQLNSTLGTTFNGESLFSQRITKYAALLSGLLSLGVGYGYIRSRKLEIASNLHVGMSRQDQGTILTLEVLLWIIPAMILAQSALVIFAVASGGSDSGAVLLLADRNQCAAVLGVSLGAWVAWITTREKHLFKYFKTR